MSLCHLNGNRCTAARVQIPAFGVPWCDVTTEAEAELAAGDAATLELADLALTGTVVSGGPFQGAARYRLAAGAAGWGKTIPAKGYANDLGVKLSSVLADAASEAGETLEAATVPSTRLGPAWAREKGPASRVLQLLAPEAWHVGEDGTTRLGLRAATPFTGQAARVGAATAWGSLELAADSIATLLPGAVVDEIEAVDVLHELCDGTLRTTIWGAGLSSTSRRLAAHRRLLLQLLPELRFAGVFEYRVVTQEGERLNLQAVRVSQGMPDLRRVKVRPGVPGCRADVALGSVVLVAFVDRNPARPVVVAFEDAEGDGFAPDRLDLVGADDLGVDAAGAIGRVVRYGDPMTFPSPGPGVVTLPGTPASLSRVRA